MKIALFLSVFIFLSVNVLAGQKLKVNQHGEIHVVGDSLDWQKLSDSQLEAYNNPGVEIPFDSVAKHKRKDFFHYVIIKEYSEIIVYIMYIVFLILPILLMIIFHILAWKEKDGAFIFAVLATCFAAVSFLISAALGFAVVSVVFSLAVAAGIGVIALKKENIPKYKIFIILFYIFAVASLFV